MTRRPLLFALASLLIAPLRALAAPKASSAPDRRAIIRQVYAKPAAGIPYTAQHAALTRLLLVQWLPIESGAPGLRVKQPLQGGQHTLAIARKALKTSDDALAIRRLTELCRLIPSYVETIGTLRPGPYAVPAELKEAFAFPESGVDSRGMFVLRQEHLTLLRAANWREVDRHSVDAVLREGDQFWPMPYIDGKRPYGNASHYQIDMAGLLGEPYALDARGYAIADPAKDARLEGLHHETLAALQVFLSYSSVKKATRNTLSR